jgi:hypothetical protein
VRNFFSDMAIAVVLTVGFVGAALFLHHAHLLIHNP